MNKIMILSIVGLALATGIAIGQHGVRFERIYVEAVDDDLSYGGKANFTVFHDKQTGQEILCISHGTYDSESCLMTGRKW